MKKLRLLSLCSGIGGADLAAEWTGAIEIAGQVELDDFCIQVLEQHWPHVKRLRDIKDVQGDEFGRIDLVAGGIPCQPFSSAGKQRGADDDRYNVGQKAPCLRGGGTHRRIVVERFACP